jgi:hypothetical protein
MTLVLLRPNDALIQQFTASRRDGLWQHSKGFSNPVEDSHCGLPSGAEVPGHVFSLHPTTFLSRRS